MEGVRQPRENSKKCAISKIVPNLAGYGKKRLSVDGPVRTHILGEPIVHRRVGGGAVRRPRTTTARRRAVKCCRTLTFVQLANQLDATEPEVVYRGRP